MSPRRSVRARQNQPLTASLDPTNSSSSTSSGRAERGTRSTLRQESFNKSQTPQLTSDDSEAMDAPEQQARQTRQKKRAQDTHEDMEIALVTGDTVDDDVDADAEEEEVTRCVCRKQEYPGPPIPLEEGNRSHKAKDQQSGISVAALDGLPEDAGSLFIQCDDCKVWQHGGCVGIMEEATSPENYYCEECRKDLHKLMTGARGQRYSRYLPVYEILHPPPKLARKSPPTKESESRSSRDPDVKAAAAAAAAAAASISSAKRRSTMNSRAAMDEEEALRKAIEESKSDGSVVNFGNGSRKGKRTRDDSEETKHDLKRRKTGSDPDSPLDIDIGILGADSDEDESSARRKPHQAGKKSRAAASQVQKEKKEDMHEREKEKERERLEAAGRRKGRAERRRVDESEPPEETTRIGATPRMALTTKSSRSQIAKLPISATPLATPSVSHKKQPRASARKAKVGRNQHTKDRDGGPESKMDTPQPSNSRDSDEFPNGGNEGHGLHLLSNGSKPAKTRQMNPSKITLLDLRKRAAGILDYVSRTQVEMAGDRTPPTGGNNTTPSVSNGSAPTILPPARPQLARNTSVNGASKLSRQLDGGDDQVNPGKVASGVDESLFKQMTSLQMMDVLTREIVHWQKDYGKVGDK